MKTKLGLLLLGSLLGPITTFGAVSADSLSSETAPILLHREQIIAPQMLTDLKMRYLHLSEGEKKEWGSTLAQLVVSKEVYAVSPAENATSEKEDELDQLLSRAEKLNKVVDQFIILGEKIMTLVKKGESVRTLNTETVKVLPFKDDGENLSILQTEHWRGAQAQNYQIVYKNFYGVRVVDFTYSVGMSAGGSYQGKGKYLTGVYAAPQNLLLRWGFDFNAESKVLAVTNLGSKEDPIVGLTLGLSYDVSNVLNSDYSVDRFLLTGNGEIKYLGP